MDCEDYRQRIEADPAWIDEAGAAHERDCGACAAYARRLRVSERLISEALRFDVASVREQDGAMAAPRRRRPIGTTWAMAASAGIAAVGVWLVLTFLPSGDPDRLVAVVQDHWYHEPTSWVQTSAPVNASVLETALSGTARVDLERLSVVSYARSCLVNGRWVPHLVVQGQAGPVMLLLLSREAIADTLPLDLPQEGLHGVIMPLDEGSIAILGDDDESLEALQQDVAAAVEWAI
ncbi:MAG: DUF3379 domain-containing protein [Gammaproteobacteria bacterium]|nr:DUF3379 domain-containing protein [Gammaproteobacteria bacterium]MDH3507112.1 DUF3379 domain-containing protein [Gammaproteobacteria bacterium]